MRYRILLLILSFTILRQLSFSQVVQTTRFEKLFKFSDEEFSVISLEEDGIALIRSTDQSKAGNRTWEVILLDTLLLEKEPILFEIENGNRIIGFEHSRGWFNALFLKSDVTKEMVLVSLDLSSKSIVKHSLKTELNFQLTHFCKVGQNFILGGFVNMEPCLLLFSTENENLILIPGFFQKNTELIDVRVNQNETFNALIVDHSNLDNRRIIFKTFDSTGKQLLEDITTVNENISIQSGVSSALKRDELMVFGTWGKKSSKASNGFFSLVINPFTNEDIRPIYFGQLNHYLDYLKPKRASIIKYKTQKAIESDKIPEFTNYVRPYKIIEHKNGFLVLAESYSKASSPSQYPTGYSPYQMSPYGYYPYYSPYGNYYPTYRGFSPSSYGGNVVTNDDLKKIESIVVNIDPNGNVLWDYSSKFIDTKTETLNQISDVCLEQDSLHLLYKKESELKIKSIDLSTEKFSESTQKLKLLFPGDKIQSEQKQYDKIDNWFENTFYVWGYQTIYNKTKNGKTRQVFYINKILVH